ncbi:hypothetical protein K8R03_04770 [Candidatus Kaiserbacteria bacterium]|nr:hypothetical protein [Candidatus Kaiserbacteria bacterium]
MLYDYHVIVGLLAAAVGLVGYAYYYRDIFRGTTTPHPFSWLSFGFLNAITFFAQVVEGGGAGTWVTGVSTVATMGIAILALQRGKKHITGFDWFCFAGALVGIALWQMTRDPLWAVIVVTVTDTIAFAPTYRKGYLLPYSETLANYVASAAKYVLGLIALEAFNWTTALYPASLVLSNLAFIAVLYMRRKRLQR